MQPRILYCDADSSYRSALEKELKGSGFDITFSDTADMLVAQFPISCPHILIMDLIQCGYDGWEVIEYLLTQRNRPFIVVFSALLTDALNCRLLDMGVDYLLYKPLPPQEMHQRIEMIIELYKNRSTNVREQEKKESIYMETTRALSELGIYPNLKGYHFVREAIVTVCESNRLIGRVTGEIYEGVAAKFGSTADCVERNIRNAIENAWIKGDLNKINDMFGNSVDSNKGKPTNSEFIALLADKIRLNRS